MAEVVPNEVGRRLLEALASALRVAPQELTGQPFVPADPLTAQAHAAIAGIEAVLETLDLGEDPGAPVRPWPDVADDRSRGVGASVSWAAGREMRVGEPLSGHSWLVILCMEPTFGHSLGSWMTLFRVR